MDEATKREIVEPILLAIQSSQEETEALVSKCIADQIVIRSELGGIRAELDALKARGSAWDAADAGHSRALADGLAEARRIATETREEAAAVHVAVTARHNELASSIARVGDEVAGIRQDVGAQVLEALGAHVASIEAAADKLTKSPRVRTGAAIAGTFAGSALVTGFIEILKHL